MIVHHLFVFVVGAMFAAAMNDEDRGSPKKGG
jgi:hypothetical protein